MPPSKGKPVDKKSAEKKETEVTGEGTKLVAPSDFEHMFHQAPSLEVKQAGRKLAGSAIQPSIMMDQPNALAVTETGLPKLVEDEITSFLKTVKREYN